ncbi:uncharacterized [Tachysurus ichikawai]
MERIKAQCHDASVCSPQVNTSSILIRDVLEIPSKFTATSQQEARPASTPRRSPVGSTCPHGPKRHPALGTVRSSTAIS